MASALENYVNHTVSIITADGRHIVVRRLRNESSVACSDCPSYFGFNAFQLQQCCKKYHLLNHRPSYNRMSLSMSTNLEDLELSRNFKASGK
ncbi:unnamed protein product, partial [Ixodes persulcatus]